MAVTDGDGSPNNTTNLSDYTNDDYINILPAPEERIINIVYPVGSIYMSVNNIDPSILFGGTWARWGVGRMPVSLNEKDDKFDTVEKTGGVATHTHTGPSHTHNIASHTHTGPSHTHTMAHTHTGPNHTHNIASHAHTTGNCTLTLNQIPSHSHKLYSFGYVGESSVANHYTVGFGTVGLRDNLQTVAVGGSQAHNHGNTGSSGTLTTTAAGTGNTSGSSAANTGASGTGSTGGSGTLTTTASGTGNTGSSSNLPPYITCYMWKRTA